MTNLVVTKANELINAEYELTKHEAYLLMFCIAKVDSTEDVPDKVKLSAKEFGEMFDIPPKDRYEALYAATRRLKKRELYLLPNEARKGGEISWVEERIVYWNGEIQIRFTRAIRPYLGQLKDNFTSYQLKQVKKLNTAHAIRFLGLLSQYKKTGLLVMTVERFRRSFGLKGKYPKFYELRRRVIEPVVKDINAANPTINVRWKGIRKGRVFQRLEFRFNAMRD